MSVWCDSHGCLRELDERTAEPVKPSSKNSRSRTATTGSGQAWNYWLVCQMIALWSISFYSCGPHSESQVKTRIRASTRFRRHCDQPLCFDLSIKREADCQRGATAAILLRSPSLLFSFFPSPFPRDMRLVSFAGARQHTWRNAVLQYLVRNYYWEKEYGYYKWATITTCTIGRRGQGTTLVSLLYPLVCRMYVGAINMSDSGIYGRTQKPLCSSAAHIHCMYK